MWKKLLDQIRYEKNLDPTTFWLSMVSFVVASISLSLTLLRIFLQHV